MPVVAVVVPLACPSEDAATPKMKIQIVNLTQHVNITFLSSLRNQTFHMVHSKKLSVFLELYGPLIWSKKQGFRDSRTNAEHKSLKIKSIITKFND